MLQVEPQDREEGLSFLLLYLLEGRPGAFEKLTAPAIQEGAVAVRAGPTRGNGIGDVGGQWPGRVLAAFAVGGDEPKEDRPDVIAESASLRIDAPKVPPNEPQRELLRQFLGRFRVTPGAEE